MEFTQICPKSGYVEHNADEIYQTVLECIKNVIINASIEPEEIDSIAITNQRETTVAFGFDGHPWLTLFVGNQGKVKKYVMI